MDDEREIQLVDSRGMSQFMPRIKIYRNQIVSQQPVKPFNQFCYPYVIVEMSNGTRYRTDFEIT